MRHPVTWGRIRRRSRTAGSGRETSASSTGKGRQALVRERALGLEHNTVASDAPGATQASSWTGGVRRLVAGLARVRPDSLVENTRLVEGLGFASLDLVELAGAFEDEFGVSLPEDRLGEATIGDLERLVLEIGRAHV